MTCSRCLQYDYAFATGEEQDAVLDKWRNGNERLE